MGDWDAPGPWWHYTTGFGLLLDFGLISSSQWHWSMVVSLYLIAQNGLIWWFKLGRTRHARKAAKEHAACLERTYYLEKDLGLTITVPVPQKERSFIDHKPHGDTYCHICASKVRTRIPARVGPG